VTNYDKCLLAYPLKEWEDLEERVDQLAFDPRVDAFQRFFFSGATECQIDKAGRILIPPSLRDFAGLTHETVIIGKLRKFEIWSKDAWTKEFSEILDQFRPITSALSQLGIKL
jgi:MraZ protein